jgi:hypothetical protein
MCGIDEKECIMKNIKRQEEIALPGIMLRR